MVTEKTERFQPPFKWSEDGQFLATADGCIAIAASATSTCGRHYDDYYGCKNHEAQSKLFVAKELRSLFESAPEMLALLQQIQRSLYVDGNTGDWRITSDWDGGYEIDQIIAKATAN